MAKEHMASGFLSGLKKGALHKTLGVPQGKPISTEKEEELKEHGTALQKKRANFALVAKTWNHGGSK